MISFRTNQWSGCAPLVVSDPQIEKCLTKQRLHLPVFSDLKKKGPTVLHIYNILEKCPLEECFPMFALFPTSHTPTIESITGCNWQWCYRQLLLGWVVRHDALKTGKRLREDSRVVSSKWKVYTAALPILLLFVMLHSRSHFQVTSGSHVCTTEHQFKYPWWYV